MYRIVITNTTLIINLLKIKKLHLFKELYGNIIVPYSVYEEIEEERDKKYYTDLKKIDYISIIDYLVLCIRDLIKKGTYLDKTIFNEIMKNFYK